MAIFDTMTRGGENISRDLGKHTIRGRRGMHVDGGGNLVPFFWIVFVLAWLDHAFHVSIMQCTA